MAWIGIRVAAVALALPLAAWAAVQDQTDQKAPVRGGTFRFAVAQEPSSLVSFLDTNTDNRKPSAKITEGLLRYDLDFNPQPLLATEWQVSADGLRYTFKLREGVKFHDGTQFSSADVRYSILKQKEAGPRGRITFANVRDVELPDAHTAVIVLDKPAPYLIRALSSAETPMVPSKRYGDAEPLAHHNTQQPIGTGPFVFKEWAKGSHLVLEKNPNYWRAGYPYLDRVIYRFINNPASISAAIEAGEVDAAFGVALADVDRLAQNPALAVDERQDAFLNNALFLEFNHDNPIVANEKVRHAIAYAFDRHFIADTIYYKRAQVVNSPIPTILADYYDDSAFNYGLDVDKANALLDEAGYQRTGNQARFALRLSFLPSAEFKRVAEYLRASLNRVGIKLEIVDGDTASFLNRVYKERGFDLNLNGLGRLFDPTVGVQRIYWSDAIRNPVLWTNAAHYNNPRVDALFSAASVEADASQRAAQFKEIQQIVGRELPVLPLVALPSGLQVYQKRVHNLNNSIDLTAGDWSNLWLEPQ